MRGRLRVVGTWLFVIAIVLVGLASAVEIIEMIPDHAMVLVDDVRRVYLPPLRKFVLENPDLRQTTYAEAHRSGYSPDPDMRDRGYFIGERDSLLTAQLKKWGVLRPEPRWNRDGTWNW